MATFENVDFVPIQARAKLNRQQPGLIPFIDKSKAALLNSFMKPTLLFWIGILLFSPSSFATIRLDPNDVRPWSKKDKDQFPSPLAAVFKKDNKTFAFVGDRHVDPKASYRLVELATAEIKPQIIVVETHQFASGENPKKHLNRYLGKTKEEVWKEPSLGCGTELIAMALKIPVIGGEPTIEEQMKSPFLLSKGHTPEDILFVQILQRIPYRRDKMNVSDLDGFLDYAMKLYRVKESKENFTKQFLSWYKAKTQRDFNYETISKLESVSLPEKFLPFVA